MIYLASNNPQRWALFEQLAIPYQVLQLRVRPERPIDIDETPLDDESAIVYVQRLASHRAQVAWHRASQRSLPALPVLAAHTAVAFQSSILDRPQNEEEAFRMLKMLSGQTHQVITAVTLLFHELNETAFSITDVSFHELSDDDICRYLEHEDDVLEKRGAYEPHGRAAAFIKGIVGSDSGAKGLPLFETAQLLERLGVM